MSKEKLIRPLKIGDTVYLKNEYKEFTPNANGGPVQVIEIEHSPDDTQFGFKFIQLKPSYTTIRQETMSASLGCINVVETNSWFSAHDRNLSKGHKNLIRAIPLLPDL